MLAGPAHDPFRLPRREGERQGDRRLGFGHGEPLLARGQEEGHLQVPGKTAQVIGERGAEGPGPQEREDRRVQPREEAGALRHPGRLAAQQLRRGGEGEPLLPAEIGSERSFLVVSECSAPRVERQHHGLGFHGLPVLDHGGDRLRPGSLEGFEPLEAVDDLEDPLHLDHGEGLLDLLRPPAGGPPPVFALEVGEARAHLLDRDLGEPHRTSPLATSRSTATAERTGFFGRARTW